MSIILSTIILLAGLIITGYEIYGEEFIMKKNGNFKHIFKIFSYSWNICFSFNCHINSECFFWFRKQIIVPLSLIEEAVEAIRKGNFEKRIKLSTGDEFEKIADAFNQMMDKLSTLIQTEEERKEMQKKHYKILTDYDSGL